MRSIPLLRFIAVVLLITFYLFSTPSQLYANSITDEITVHLESQFPKGILVRINTKQLDDITRITIRFQIIGEFIKRYDNFPTLPDSTVQLTHQIRTDTANRYIPSGSTIKYSLELENSIGERFTTQPETFTYLDPNYNWQKISGSTASIFFYGENRDMAIRILKDVEQTVQSIGDLLQIEATDPLTVTIYNSLSDMKNTLPPRSTTQTHELVVEGVFFRGANVILILGNQPNVSGVTSHETVHFLIDQKLGPMAHTIPAWLNEGLAEFGSVQPNPSSKNSLNQAIASGTLLPLTSMTSPPGDPRELILFYGESRSVIQYLLKSYESNLFQLLIENLKTGQSIDNALTAAYGFNRILLDNEWRQSIGAPPLSLISRPNRIPSSIPWPTIIPFGLETSNPQKFNSPSQEIQEYADPSGNDCIRGDFNTSMMPFWVLVGFVRAISLTTNFKLPILNIKKCCALRRQPFLQRNSNP